MAKRKTQRGSGADRQVKLRLDAQLHEDLTALADEVGVSVNQLAGAVLRWAVDRAHVGEPHEDRSGRVVGIESEQGVWFGFDSDEVEPEGPWDGGVVFFVLDFSTRRSIREF